MMTFKKESSLWSDFINLIYPQTCGACNDLLLKGEHGICLLCQHQLPKTTHHLHPINELTNLFDGRVEIVQALALFYFTKSSRIQHLLHEFKYRGKKEVGFSIGMFYGRIIKEAGHLHDLDVLLPIPLHPKKQHKRGYNQSAVFAQGIAQELEIEVLQDILFRKDYTSSQTSKTRGDRWDNVKNAFGIKKKRNISNLHIGLVDDMITTGATIDACATLLHANYNLRITVIGFATALKI